MMGQDPRMEHVRIRDYDMSGLYVFFADTSRRITIIRIAVDFHRLHRLVPPVLIFDHSLMLLSGINRELLRIRILKYRLDDMASYNKCFAGSSRSNRHNIFSASYICISFTLVAI